MGITVGRVGTNDVVIDDPSVSRFHAYFQHDERKGGWTLTDADSQNGTRVNGQKTVGHQQLEDGAKLTFGDIVTWFLEPERFCAWLAAGADPSTL
jgi:pSer/pThr/pTyr-binding forkhead associated (FHA) protein